MGIFFTERHQPSHNAKPASRTVRRMDEATNHSAPNVRFVSDNMELAGQRMRLKAMSSSRRGWVPRESVPVELDAHRHLTIADQSGLTTRRHPDAVVDEVTTVTEFDDPGTDCHA